MEIYPLKSVFQRTYCQYRPCVCTSEPCKFSDSACILPVNNPTSRRKRATEPDRPVQDNVNRVLSMCRTVLARRRSSRVLMRPGSSSRILVDPKRCNSPNCGLVASRQARQTDPRFVRLCLVQAFVARGDGYESCIRSCVV
jgi:hypothetical protein